MELETEIDEEEQMKAYFYCEVCGKPKPISDRREAAEEKAFLYKADGVVGFAGRDIAPRDICSTCFDDLFLFDRDEDETEVSR